MDGETRLTVGGYVLDVFLSGTGELGINVESDAVPGQVRALAVSPDLQLTE